MTDLFFQILNTVQRNRAAGVQSLNVKEHVGASSTPRTRFSSSPRTFEPPECKAVKLMHERGNYYVFTRNILEFSVCITLNNELIIMV